jgi:aspartyl-tRNA(Asn)/glutamyl-tRNA(Gln) amidotransferase subunit A
MPVAEVAFRPASDLAEALRRRELSVRELVEMFLARIERVDPLCRAFITVTGEDARRRADWCDQNLAEKSTASPFFGIPFATKDMFDIAGVQTTGGSKVLRGNVPTRDAAVIGQLLAAGAVSLGKTNLHEFAYGTTGCNEVFGTPLNAYDPARLACGSSSGSAAAVAHGLAVAALGTDTGGSTRIPAVLNGLVGLKPTIGRISTHGVLPFSWSLDHVGLITRTVRDCTDLLAICADQACPTFGARHPGRERSFLSGLRIGIPRCFYWENADREVLAAGEEVIRFLSRAGADIREVELADPEQARTVSLAIQMPEALSFHSHRLKERYELYGADLRSGLAVGQFILAEHYVRAKRFLSVYRDEMRALFNTVDLMLTPATPVVAPIVGTTSIRLGDTDVPIGNALARYTSFFNMTGNPAATLPCGMHSAGVPIGIQLVGALWKEEVVLAAAGAIEAAFAGAVLPPPRSEPKPY